MKKQFDPRSFTVDAGLAKTQHEISTVKIRMLSSELFGTAREVVIEHAGEEYRLRLTRQDKLILTK